MAVALTQPFNRAFAITPSDTVAIPSGTTDSVYVGGAGVVVVVFENGTTCNFTAVAGEILPVRATRINSTSTTATLMVALYCT